MPSKLRLKKIADRIKEELSEMLITGQISDPRISELYITDVEVDRELSAAKIYVSSLEGISASREILDGLSHASGFLRSVLSKRIQLRSFPELRFFWDETPEKAERIERLIDSLSKDNNPQENEFKE